MASAPLKLAGDKVAASKKIELSACSGQSWEDATRRAVAQAGHAIGSRNSVQIKRFEAIVADGEISQFCVRIEVLEAIALGELAKPARILVVDDLELIQELARSILEEAGHEVDTVPDGVQAVARIRSKPYDLVLMDIQMPIMDGIMATRAIRNLDSPASKVPILAMTTNVLPEHVRTYKAAGMNDYVGKPLNQRDFLQKLSEWLPGTRAAEQPANLPEQPVPFFDQQAFEDLRTMMSSERVSEWIAKFLLQLEATFPATAAETPSRELLARDAHALVSHAALLGFLEFSLLCSELEGACISGGDLDAPIQRVRSAARIVASQAHKISNINGDKAMKQ